jgi:hypothetical protein
MQAACQNRSLAESGSSSAPNLAKNQDLTLVCPARREGPMRSKIFVINQTANVDANCLVQATFVLWQLAENTHRWLRRRSGNQPVWDLADTVQALESQLEEEVMSGSCGVLLLATLCHSTSWEQRRGRLFGVRSLKCTLFIARPQPTKSEASLNRAQQPMDTAMTRAFVLLLGADRLDERTKYS